MNNIGTHNVNKITILLLLLTRYLLPYPDPVNPIQTAASDFVHTPLETPDVSYHVGAHLNNNLSSNELFMYSM